MNEGLTIGIFIAFLFSSIRLATPLIFAALGGMFSERSGVINIALEGLMLAGAFVGAVATYELGNPFLGLLFTRLPRLNSKPTKWLAEWQ
jgi:simple sugar transport system permease protein